jgi:hypothetical protein
MPGHPVFMWLLDCFWLVLACSDLALIMVHRLRGRRQRSGLTKQAQMAADYPDPLPESMAPMPRLRLLARFSWPWNGTLVLTSNFRAPKAPTALDFRCSHFDLAQLEDLLPLEV